MTAHVPGPANADDCPGCVAEALARAERAETRISEAVALYEQWVKAGPPPLGTPIARWWDRRLIELRSAIYPTDTEETPMDQQQQAERRADIADDVTRHTKELLARRTETLRKRAEEAEAERDEMRGSHQRACETIAAMHAAATGRTGEGPVRGVVEDVEDVRLRAEQAEKERDGAYRERAHLVALLAAMTPGAVITYATDVDEPGWQIVYLNLGGRQASWHISPRDAELFQHVERVEHDDPRGHWDGHTTEEKYEGIAAWTAELMQQCGPECAEMHRGGFRCTAGRD